jgi:ATP-dependent Zn protease
MSDIYKNQQQVQVAVNKPKRRRRRSSSRSAFDEDGNRRRRSSNSGVRRWLHLFRKPANEKKIWMGMLITAVVLLTIIGLWQFVYMEHVARKKTMQNEMVVPLQNPRPADSAAE